MNFNRFPDLVGFHAGELMEPMAETLVKLRELSNVMQFHVTKKTLWEYPGASKSAKDALGYILWANKDYSIRPVIHCPFIVTMTKDMPKLWLFTKQYTVKLYQQIKEFDPKLKIPFVLHTGKPDKGAGAETAAALLEKSVGSLLAAFDQHGLDNAQVAIETDASPLYPCTRFDGILSVVEKYGDPRIGICLDTEHSYASGAMPEPTYDQWKWIKVVHLNVIPEKVRFGSGKDAHRDMIITGKELLWLKYIAVMAKSRRIPMILERHDLEVVKADISYLNGALTEGPLTYNKL